jgi:hypothetical protein
MARQLVDFNYLFDMINKQGEGQFVTVCYLSSVAFKKTMRTVNADDFGNALDNNRIEGDEDNYKALKGFQSGETKKFPFQGIAKMTTYKFHWQSRKTFAEKYKNWKQKTNDFLNAKGLNPIGDGGAWETEVMDYGDDQIEVRKDGDNPNKNVYIRQNLATCQTLSKAYYLIDQDGRMLGGTKGDVVKTIMTKRSPEQPFDRFQKLENADEVTREYLEHMADTKFKPSFMMKAGSVLFLVLTTREGNEYFAINNQLANEIGSSKYALRINPQDFIDKANKAYQEIHADGVTKRKTYKDVFGESRRGRNLIPMTEGRLYNIVAEAVMRIAEAADFDAEDEGGEEYDTEAYVDNMDPESAMKFMQGNYDIVKVPVYYINYLVNGDVGDLSDEEVAAIDEFQDRFDGKVINGLNVCDVCTPTDEAQPSFYASNDVDGNMGADCYRFLIPLEPEA